MKALFTRRRADWETPPELFRKLDREFGFTLDVCATPANAKCPTFYTAEQDGLQQPWTGVVWCNPPFGRDVDRWLSKARRASNDGATVVVLVPARTDTEWWHQEVEPACRVGTADVRFIRGRVPFVRADGERSRSPFPSALIIYRPRAAVG